VVKRGLPTGPEAEQAAIDEALAEANQKAQNAMKGCRCQGDCLLGFRLPKIRIRSSGSQNNPAYPIIGAAIAVWTIYPICTKPPRPAAKPKPPRPQRQPVDTDLPPMATGQNPYPFTRNIACGIVKIEIQQGGPKPGSITFDFQKDVPPSCH
jgi:hypothetical protein